MKVSKRDNLDRYYLLKLFGYGVFLHKIHHDEDVDVYHNHPWDGISLIFGSYLEERLGEQPKVKRFINIVKAERYHRVSLPKGLTWTLFIHGRRYNKWTVVNKKGKVLSEEPWRGVDGEQKSYVKKYE